MFRKKVSLVIILLEIVELLVTPNYILVLVVAK